MADISFLHFEDEWGHYRLVGESQEVERLSDEEVLLLQAEAIVKPCPYCLKVSCECEEDDGR